VTGPEVGGQVGGEVVAWTLVLAGLVLLAYAGMLLGWRRRGQRHDLPPLVPTGSWPPATQPLLEARGRYFGSTTAGRWLDRIVAHGLGTRSPVRLVLSPEALEVHRPRGDFRIAADAVEGARHDQGIAGKVVPPHGVLVVTWRHGSHRIDSGFRLADSGTHDRWVTAISRLSKEQHA
jgi:hypothetical protein